MKERRIDARRVEEIRSRFVFVRSGLSLGTAEFDVELSSGINSAPDTQARRIEIDQTLCGTFEPFRYRVRRVRVIASIFCIIT